MDEFTRRMLRMEDVMERTMEIDKRVAEEVGADRAQIVEGRCTSCERLYPPTYLQKGDCIPCWRKKNDLPKIDAEIDF
ncbi:hypothetical protein ACFO5R_00905 [Halosolutus amylolyticus]|uniref:Uncharacterized protein n=1 Tax=Halosolutus amylolyticus TaxID=2932267 RepID=A0ABD5PKC5_9EURY|nr:hypothetical protein [Halosolutus amylolyticus]